MSALLRVEDLAVRFDVGDRQVDAVVQKSFIRI